MIFQSNFSVFFWVTVSKKFLAKNSDYFFDFIFWKGDALPVCEYIMTSRPPVATSWIPFLSFEENFRVQIYLPARKLHHLHAHSTRKKKQSGANLKCEGTIAIFLLICPFFGAQSCKSLCRLSAYER